MYCVITMNDEGKRFSYVDKFDRSYNLAAYIRSRPWLEVMLVASSKKEAEEIAEMWNREAEEAGELSNIIPARECTKSGRSV